jgi:hypothetical protein
MPIKPRTLRVLTGAALATATVATRVPFRSHTLFEFDSVDFAVATFRFDLGQITPHVPGNILHVLAGRLLSTFTTDLNSAFVALSVILSVASVLLLWRAAAQLRGERVGLIAAVLWLTTPMFWFTGCVATAYIHEAFFCSALLYLGIRWLRQPGSTVLPMIIAATLGLSIGARQNDVLFYAPAVVLLFQWLRPSRKTTINAIAAFTLVCLMWGLDLLIESGGIVNYLAAFSRERGFRTQSILFGNSWHAQLNATSKVLFYLPFAIGPVLLGWGWGFIRWPKRTIGFIRSAAQARTARFALWLALPSFVFYLVIYFMKAGYLLTLVPIAVVASAVLLDMIAIWQTEKIKVRINDELLLTRPLITRRAVLITAFIAVLNILWFVARLPGIDTLQTFDEATRESFSRGVEDRLATSQSRLATIANRVLSNTNVNGIRAIDSLNTVTADILERAGANDSTSVVIATWWDRQAYIALKHAYVYDVQPMGDTIAVGISHNSWRVPLDARSIALPTHKRLFLLMRHDHPDFQRVSAGHVISRLNAPPFIDIYRKDDSSDIVWRNARFH